MSHQHTRALALNPRCATAITQDRLKPAIGWLSLSLCLPLPAAAQTLAAHDEVRTYSALTNTTVTMSGRTELRVTGTNDPIPGCTIHLNSPDAWLLLSAIEPSQVASTFLSRVRVNGAGAVLDANFRVVQ